MKKNANCSNQLLFREALLRFNQEKCEHFSQINGWFGKFECIAKMED